MPLCDLSLVNVKIDSVEFLDDVIHPQEKSFIDFLILQEMKLMQSESASSSSALVERYVEGSPLAAQIAAIPASSAFVLAEMDRIRQQLAAGSLSKSLVSSSHTIDTRRHEEFPETPVDNDPTLWELAVRKAETTLEAQSIRGINVTLAEKYSVGAWGSTTRDVSVYVEEARKRVASLQKQKEDMNASRVETASGTSATKMKNLEKKTRQIQETNFELEVAIAKLQSDAKRIRRQEESQ
jgi:hypothetical protein